jgi:transglutaminase-like putative cysteine protease
MDTLVIRRESAPAFEAQYTLPMGGRQLLRRYTRSEPTAESGNPEIVRLMLRIVGGASDPRVAAERINRWVFDSVNKHVAFGIPDALRVLHSRVGDCKEHTQLFVALARSAGVPTRIASGLVYLDGKFYYHVWPEIFLEGWVAVDPTFGQFPADAAHVRFLLGGLDRQAEVVRLIATLRIDVLAARDSVRSLKAE